ncbi:MAG: GlcG/HbpS family heme-binding protein [Hyphomicrobiaceae bacterium]
MSKYFLVNVASSMCLADAEAIAAGALRAARDEELLPLTVAVLDAGGQLIVFKREDGCGIVRGDIAIGKASAALGMGSSGRVLRDRLKDRIAFQAAIAAASDGRFVAVPGGVLIRNNEGLAIGAIGISGDASDRDEYAAIAGIQAAGFLSYPAEPAEGWKDAGL